MACALAVIERRRNNLKKKKGQEIIWPYMCHTRTTAGLVFKARLLYHSPLDLRVIKKKKDSGAEDLSVETAPAASALVIIVEQVLHAVPPPVEK